MKDDFTLLDGSRIIAISDYIIIFPPKCNVRPWLSHKIIHYCDIVDNNFWYNQEQELLQLHKTNKLDTNIPNNMAFSKIIDSGLLPRNDPPSIIYATRITKNNNSDLIIDILC